VRAGIPISIDVRDANGALLVSEQTGT